MSGIVAYRMRCRGDLDCILVVTFWPRSQTATLHPSNSCAVRNRGAGFGALASAQRPDRKDGTGVRRDCCRFIRFVRSWPEFSSTPVCATTLPLSCLLTGRGRDHPLVSCEKNEWSYFRQFPTFDRLPATRVRKFQRADRHDRYFEAPFLRRICLSL